MKGAIGRQRTITIIIILVHILSNCIIIIVVLMHAILAVPSGWFKTFSDDRRKARLRMDDVHGSRLFFAFLNKNLMR